METANTNQKLKFYLLGPPEILLEGQVLDIPRRQVRTLLYLLATHERWLPYQTLHFLFWSNKPEKECRRNLSHLFTHIRNYLPDKNILIQNSVSVKLDSKLFYSDVIEFSTSSNRPYTENDFAHLIHANRLYKGAYLEGKYLPNSHELEIYVEQKKRNLEARYLKNLSSLIQIYKKLNKTSKAIECAEAYLSLDNYNEDILNELLILHSYLGNNSRVIQLYNDFSQLLQDQLDIKPSRKTRTIFEQIIAASQDSQIPSFSPEPNTIDSNPSLDKYQLSNLQALRKIINGQNSSSGIVLIAGDVGMGKSELITNYLAHSPPDLVDFRITCTPTTQKIRIYPFRELARKLISPDVQNGLNTNFLTENLNQIAVQLSKPVQIHTPATDDLINLIFERDYALIRELFGEIGKLPVALNLIIENIEWADEESLEMLLLFLEKPFPHQINFICSYCCKREEKLKIFLQDIQATQAHLGTIQMKCLSHEDIQYILQEQFGMVNESSRVAKQLFQMTSGNYFYLSEILQEMHQNKLTQMQLSSTKTFDIPKPITQKFYSRFERLSSNEKKFLQFAAVRDSGLSFEDVRELLNLSSYETVELVNDLICRNLIDHDANTYSIKNEIIRKSILDSLTHVQKQVLQGSIDQSLNKFPN